MGRVTLGQEIKRLRIEADITLRGFAGKVGITPAFQSDIEHDRRRPSEDVLRRIAHALRAVGATYEGLDALETRIDADLREWAAETPGIRQMLRTMHDSDRDPREIMREVEKALAKQRKRT